MIELLAQIRPQWVSAVDDAWFNWRFIVGFLIPPCLFYITNRYRWGGLISFPFAAAGFWFLVSMGIYNVSDVMAANALTDDELDLACGDTGRNLAPFLSVPPVSLMYTLLSFGCVAFLHSVFRSDNFPAERPCPNCGGLRENRSQLTRRHLLGHTPFYLCTASKLNN